MLTNKAVLYIGLDYFRFPQSISEEILSLGASRVDFFSVKKKGIINKLTYRIAPMLDQYIRSKYHLNIIKNLKCNDYDYVLINHVHLISHKNMTQLKMQLKNTFFINFNWDSIAKHNYLDYIKYFDKVFSFDPQDAKKHNKITYLPLFYTKEFGHMENEQPKNNNSVLFFGTYNNYIRYLYVKKLQNIFNHENIVFFNYLSVHWMRYIRTIYEDRKILNPKYFVNQPPSIKKILDLYRKTDCILDIPNNNQSGLTMRVLEALGAGKYLITTNETIKNENIYNSDYVFVLTENNFEDMIRFIKKRKKILSITNIEKYSLNNWVKTIFDLNKNK